MRKLYLGCLLTMLLVSIAIPQERTDNKEICNNKYIKQTEGKKNSNIILKPLRIHILDNTIINIDVKGQEDKPMTVNSSDISSSSKDEVLDRGGGIVAKRVEFHITYYTNAINKMEGGHKDKKGKSLTSHDTPVLAMPKDVKYGAMVVFDEMINGSKEYKNVDTGGAIVWLNDEKTICKVDIFIPDVTPKFIEKHYQNKVVMGWLYNYK